MACMVRIFIDTNFLMMPGRLKVDVFSAISAIVPEKPEFIVLEESVRELEQIAQAQRTKQLDRLAARLGVFLIKQQHLKTVRGSGNCDQLLLDHARKGEYVATQDKGLKMRLRKKGVHILTLRQKKHVIIEN
jgi:rRNA-processing protein FCF1